MRDKSRIHEIMSLVTKIWEQHQDLRFFQLLYILQSKYSKENENVGIIEQTEKDGFSNVGFDFFNIEDDDFIMFLRTISESKKL